MAIEVSFTVPRELAQNATIRKHLWNIALYIRDFWLARAPSNTGAYAKGLLMPGSVKVSGNRILIRNLAPHAQYYEYGHREFNIGMAMLEKGKNVFRSKEGYRYKRVRISDRRETKFRSPGVSEAVSRSFMSMTPPGLGLPVISRYGAAPRYEARKSLRKMMKPGKITQKGADCVTVSEKAIRLDPTKWLVPAMVGRNLAKTIQREVRPLIVQSLHAIVKSEKDRQRQAAGRAPKWSAAKKGIVRTGPITRLK